MTAPKKATKPKVQKPIPPMDEAEFKDINAPLGDEPIDTPEELERLKAEQPAHRSNDIFGIL